jgi:HAD superfamily hydrolase (TIGR01509 family)
VIRAVAWDVDGTLIDSEPAHHEALMRVSARYGVPVAPDDPRFVGLAMEQVFDALAPLYPVSLNQQQWLDEIVADYVASASRLRPMAGAREAVAALAKAGVPQACVSNSARPVVAANLARLEVGGAFAFTVARDDVARGKPDPEPYALACRRLGAAPDETLAIEDSDVGAASARAAGLQVWRVDPAGEVFARLVALAAQWTPLATP